MKKFKFVPYTYCDPKFLDRTEVTTDHLRFYAENCRKLAAFMKALPKEQHYQNTWTHNELDSNKCGTPACALGWAAYSNEISGLQFGINGEYDNAFQIIKPVVNGGAVMSDGFEEATELEDSEAAWPKAGPYFFGDAVQRQVFNDGTHSKEAVVRLLRMWAARYDLRAKAIDNGNLTVSGGEGEGADDRYLVGWDD